MCLLITHPKAASADPVHDEWLRDWYKSNRDGFGFMYADGGVLKVDKSLGTVENFIEAWRKHEALGVDFACHLRMRTHGNTDLDNCHPYQILGPESGNEMWLMHNGILQYGNKADTTKSDTWHFIKDWLRPLLDPAQGGNPKLVFKEPFVRMLESLIGSSNKFVIMDCDGDVATVNYGAGVTWAGMWLSNRYAWSCSDTGSKDGLPKKWVPTGEGSAAGYGEYYSGREFMKDVNGNFIRRQSNANGEWRKGKFMTHAQIKELEAKGEKSETTTPRLALVGGSATQPELLSEEQENALVAQLAEAGDDAVSASHVFADMRELELRTAWQAISYPSMDAFITRFGARDVYRLMDLVLDKVMDESTLITCMGNYKVARQYLQPVWQAEVAKRMEAAKLEQEKKDAEAKATAEAERVLAAFAPKPAIAPVDADPAPTGTPEEPTVVVVEQVSEQEAATEATLAESEAVAIVVQQAVIDGEGI